MEKCPTAAADLILSHANAITLDPAHPRAETVLIRNGKVAAVGDGGALNALGGPDTHIIDCKGQTVLPGFIDAHCHLLAFAESLVSLNLEVRTEIHSISDLQDKIRQVSRNAPPGSWIRGRYNEFYLAEKRHPTRWELDRATSLHPVRLVHRSGGAHVLNSLALGLVGISREAADPPEGLIERELPTGEPTGLLYGFGDVLARKVPPLDRDSMEQAIRLADERLCSSGITTIHDASSRNDLDRWSLFSTWKSRGLIRPRIRMMLGWKAFDACPADHLLSWSTDDDHLRMGGVKIIVHETTGSLSPSQEELNARVLRIHREGSQAVLHAVEENAISACCRAIAHALNHVPRSNHRHRIEHCSVCSPSLAGWIASLGITVVTQPSFIYYSGHRYLSTVPDPHFKNLYPLRRLTEAGITVAGSSDAPIVPISPIVGIYAAVSRKSDAGELILPEEKIAPEAALRMYIEGAARAGFEENSNGSIRPGKLADLVILSADPTRVPVDEIKHIEVEKTIIGGKIAWEKGG
jgi:predicted amidohydrolase YtcJ